jgi:hypothetical protein
MSAEIPSYSILQTIRDTCRELSECDDNLVHICDEGMRRFVTTFDEGESYIVDEYSVINMPKYHVLDVPSICTVNQLNFKIS